MMVALNAATPFCLLFFSCTNNAWYVIVIVSRRVDVWYVRNSRNAVNNTVHLFRADWDPMLCELWFDDVRCSIYQHWNSKQEQKERKKSEIQSPQVVCIILKQQHHQRWIETPQKSERRERIHQWRVRCKMWHICLYQHWRARLESNDEYVGAFCYCIILRSKYGTRFYQNLVSICCFPRQCWLDEFILLVLFDWE